MWCGKSYEEHSDEKPTIVIPRVPCLLWKGGHTTLPEKAVKECKCRWDGVNTDEEITVSNSYPCGCEWEHGEQIKWCINCPKVKDTPEPWEVRFDNDESLWHEVEDDPSIGDGGSHSELDFDKVKQFIRNLLNEKIKEVEKLKYKHKDGVVHHAYEDLYNHVIRQAINILKK